VIGVILSGTLTDGAAGMRDIKLGGGLTVVQHPDDALYSGMPCSVLTQIDVDRVLPAASIAAALVELLEET
jgi:two-component system chemotaxis response regulator CheB